MKSCNRYPPDSVTSRMKRFCRRCLFLLMPAFLPFIAFSQDIPAKADALLQAYNRLDQFSGTVLIAKRGKIIFEKGYGLADREKGLPNGVATRYRIGSVTKPFTATLILLLQEKGRLSVNDPIGRYLPGYPKGDSVTIRHLLTHTSGIQSLTSMKQYHEKWMGEKTTLPQTISYFRDAPYTFAPGTRYAYSNSNYILLSYIAEKAGGKPFEDLLQQYILGPLRMQDSGMDSNEGQGTAKGYEAVPGTDFAPAKFIDMSLMSGAGAMYSTVRDLYRFDRALYTKELLSAASKKEAFTPFKNNYGYGWEIDTVNGRVQLSHSGAINGFLANIVRYPAEDVCIVFLSNYFESKGAAISRALTAIAFEEAFTMPRERVFLQMDAGTLKGYTGTFVMENGPGLEVFTEGGKLKGRLGAQQPFVMLPVSQKEFYIKAIDSDVHFMFNAFGVVEGLFIQQGKKQLRFKKNETRSH